MRAGTLGLVAVVVGFAGIPRPAEAGEDVKPKPKPSITIRASPSILPKDTRCVVELTPEETDRTTVLKSYAGKIVKAGDDGVLLAVSEEKLRHVSKKPDASRIPFGDRLFNTIGITHHAPGKEREVWIPVETIRAVTLVAQPRS